MLWQVLNDEVHDDASQIVKLLLWLCALWVVANVDSGDMCRSISVIFFSNIGTAYSKKNVLENFEQHLIKKLCTPWILNGLPIKLCKKPRCRKSKYVISGIDRMVEINSCILEVEISVFNL